MPGSLHGASHSPPSDYSGVEIYYRSTRQLAADLLRTEDYCFRYDTECHWLTRTVPPLEWRPVRRALGKRLLGSTNLVHDVGGMTGTLTVRYREPTPALQPIELVGWVERVEGRKVFTRGEMRHAERLTAEASGIFIGGSLEKLRAAAAA